jgi:hypothetical protein
MINYVKLRFSASEKNVAQCFTIIKLKCDEHENNNSKGLSTSFFWTQRVLLRKVFGRKSFSSPF